MPSDEHYLPVGRAFAAARALKGWSQETTAHAAGLSLDQVSFIERDARPARWDVMCRLCAALDITQEWMLSTARDVQASGKGDR